MRSRTLITLLATGLLLGSAAPSDAILKWIHKLSGPGPFLGAVVKCRVDVPPVDAQEEEGYKLRECGVGGGVGLGDEPLRPFNLAFALSAARTLENDLDYGRGPGVGAPDVTLLSAEPSVEWWLKREGRPIFLETGLSIKLMPEPAIADAISSASRGLIVAVRMTAPPLFMWLTKPSSPRMTDFA